MSPVIEYPRFEQTRSTVDFRDGFHIVDWPVQFVCTVRVARLCSGSSFLIFLLAKKHIPLTGTGLSPRPVDCFAVTGCAAAKRALCTNYRLV